MIFNKNLKNVLLVIFTTLLLSACSTAKKAGTGGDDAYTGKETVKYLASGVPDRVFFATNKSSLNIIFIPWVYYCGLFQIIHYYSSIFYIKYNLI